MSSNPGRTRRIGSPMGKQIIAFFDQAIADHDRLPGKTAILAQIAEEFGTLPGVNQEKLYEAFVGFATKAQRSGGSGGPSRFELRGHIFELADQLVDRIEKADRIIDVPDEEPIDVGATLNAMDDAGDPWAKDKRKAAKEQAEARALMDKAGYGR